MSNWNKDAVLDFLVREAPKAPLARAMSLAQDVEGLSESEFYLKKMLAALSPLLLEENGAIKKEYAGHRPAILKALETVSSCHAWTVCGPVDDGLERMMCEIEGKEYSPQLPTGDNRCRN